MKGRRSQMVGAAAIVVLLAAAVVVLVRWDAPVWAEEGTGVEPVLVEGITAPLLQYQGRLSDPDTGQPVADGSYKMVLKLYKAASGGTALWTEAKQVPLQDGLFSTVLGDSSTLDQGLFDGRELWLGIKVGSDPEAKPRQQILPTAYALGLVPGAMVQGKGGSAALTVGNSGNGLALETVGPVEVDGDLTVAGKLVGGAHIHNGHNNDPNAHHKRYTDKEAEAAALASEHIVDQYSFDDHIYGGMHNNRALAYGVIDQFGDVAFSSGNVSADWDGLCKCFEIKIDGHSYDHWSYVTVVTPITYGAPSVWSSDGKLNVGFWDYSSNSAVNSPFHFVTFH